MGLRRLLRRGGPSAADVLRWVGEELAEEVADLQTEGRRLHAEDFPEGSKRTLAERRGVNRAQHIVAAALAAVAAGELRGASGMEITRSAHRRHRRAVEVELEERRQRIAQERLEKSR